MLSSFSAIKIPKEKTFEGVLDGKYHLIDTIPLWNQLYKELKTKKVTVWDTETNGLNFLVNQIVGFSVSWGKNNCYYIPIRHETDEKQLRIDQIINDLKELFQNKDHSTVWHNFKFDGHFLNKEGIVVSGIVHDTILMQAIIDENSLKALKNIAVREIHPEADKWEKIVAEWRAKYGRKNKISKIKVHYGIVPLKIMTPYACADVHYTWLIFKKFLPIILADKDLFKIYSMESQLILILLDMEERGVIIDLDYLRLISPELEESAEILKKKILKYLGNDEININSTKQLIPLLKKKGVKFTKKTKGGKSGIPQDALDQEVLTYLATKYKVFSNLLKYRTIKKLKKTYVDNIIEKSLIDQKLHCEYNQNVVTGRMSSKNPNVQNVPRGDKTIRRAFIAPLDNYLVFVDLSQIEIRLTAHASQDPILLDVYNNTKEDVHTRTMCEMFEYKYKEIIAILENKNHSLYEQYKDERNIAKMTNFLIIYGGGAKNLASRISTPQKKYSEEQCQEFIDNYFIKYKGIKQWLKDTKVFVRKHLQVQNFFGRYRRFPELENSAIKYHNLGERWKIERAERQACNFIIQSSAADLFKKALIRIHRILKSTKSQIVIPVHDEIIFYLHKKELHLIKDIVHQMQNFCFSVPIIAEVNYSIKSWADKKPLK